MLRKALGATPAATALLAGTVHDIFNAVAASLCDDFAFITADQADEGSDIFYPSTVPVAVVGAIDIATFTPFQKITHTRFAGKAFGSRASIEMYGIPWYYSNEASDTNTIGYDGVVTAAEFPAIGTIVGFLNTQAFANSGGPTTWYPRATVKVNDFWLRQVRNGGIS
jgi:hypothetical protein